MMSLSEIIMSLCYEEHKWNDITLVERKFQSNLIKNYFAKRVFDACNRFQVVSQSTFCGLPLMPLEELSN